MPTSGAIHQNYYAYDFEPPNQGGTPRLPVVAAAKGEVVKRVDGGGCTGSLSDNSQLIVKHDDGSFSEYVHMDVIHVVDGEHVEQGELLGRVGCQGAATGVHLHFARLWDADSGDGRDWKSMKTNFDDEKASGTGPLAAASPLTYDKWYLSYNGGRSDTYVSDEPCSHNEKASASDDRYAIPDGLWCARYYLDWDPLGKREDETTSSTKPNPTTPNYTLEKKLWTGLSRLEEVVDHNWSSSGFPEASYLGVEYDRFNMYFNDNAPDFSARWMGRFNFGASSYKFTLTSSDGIRLYVNNILEFEEWTTRSSPQTWTTIVAFPTSGPRVIRIDYFNRGSGAQVDAWWVNCMHGGCP